LAVQVLAGVFFLGDVLADAIRDGGSTHLYLEALVAVALCGGLAVSAAALRTAHEHIRSQEQALAVAAGALHDVVEAQFEAWGLTAAERDVGMLALKGLDVGDIAALRGAAAGTVRAQLSRVYTKAGVTGRAQFVALFVEDLLAGLPGEG
jgi:DNA-binding CsgD family transcriptional regulator